jgi:competence ComEA-like helix-hairpin-helix protein
VCAVFAAALLAGRQSKPLAVGREMPLWDERIAAATERINPNTASAGSLQRLPGVGRIRAESIVAYRLAHGPVAFRCPEDLARIWGIGPAIVHNAAQHLVFDRPAAAIAAQSAPAAALNPPPGGS